MGRCRPVLFLLSIGLAVSAFADTTIHVSDRDFSQHFGKKFQTSLEQAKLGYDEKTQSISVDGTCAFCTVIGLIPGDKVLLVNGQSFAPNPMVPLGTPETGLIYAGSMLNSFSTGQDKTLRLRISRSGKVSDIVITRAGAQKGSCKPAGITADELKKKLKAIGACPESTCTDISITDKGPTSVTFAIKGRTAGFSNLSAMIDTLNEAEGFTKVRDKRSDQKGEFIEFELTGLYSCD